MESELQSAFRWGGMYIVVWCTTLGGFAAAKALFQAFTTLPKTVQEAWISGLGHVRMLISVFLAVAIFSLLPLASESAHSAWSLLHGSVAALGIHVLSRKLRP